MRVLLLSLDASICDPTSVSAERMREYGREVEALWVVVVGQLALGRKLQAQRISTPPYLSFGRGGVVGESAANVHVVSVAGQNKMVRWVRALRAAQRVMHEHAIDVVSSQDPFETALIGYLATRARHGRGFHIQIHGDFFGSPFWRKESVLNRVRLQFGKFLVRRARAVRVVSQRIKVSIAALGVRPDRVTVAPIAIHLPPHEERVVKDTSLLAGREARLLWVGRLSREKNVGMLIDVCADLMRRFSHLTLAIVGDGSQRGRLEERVRARGANNRITFHGFQSDLAPFYQSADIFVFPSLHEGYGRAPIEAMGYGLPVVMSDVGHAGEIVLHEHNGLVVPPGEAFALTAAIERLIADPTLRARLGRAGRETVMRLPRSEEINRSIVVSWRSSIEDTTHRV